jgi:hypothetical protein
MNGLNQMIAQGVRPVQIESPVNQMAQFEQIRHSTSQHATPTTDGRASKRA